MADFWTQDPYGPTPDKRDTGSEYKVWGKAASGVDYANASQGEDEEEKKDEGGDKEEEEEEEMVDPKEKFEEGQSTYSS